MSSIDEIETAIDKLSDEDFDSLREWLWDRQIARDQSKGLLGGLVQEASDAFERGEAKPL